MDLRFASAQNSEGLNLLGTAGMLADLLTSEE